MHSLVLFSFYIEKREKYAKRKFKEVHNEFARVSRIEIENEKKRGR